MAFDGGEEAHRVECRVTAQHHPRWKASADRFDGEHGRRGRRRGTCPFGDPGDRRLAAAVTIGAANLDPQRPLQPFRVRGPEHRQARRQAIPTSGRHASADAGGIRERSVEQQRIGELGAVAVACAHRFGEPAQLPTAARPALDPLPVVPPRREAVQRPVVLAGAGRAGRAVHGDVDLVATRELLGEMSGDQPRQPG